MTDAARALYPVILVGGRGARLWPVSRESLPKVFQPLSSDKTMIQETCARLSGLASLAPPVVVCNKDHTFLVTEQLSAEGIETITILAEPVRRNTAPAVAAAATWIAGRDPDALMLVLPADHVITDVPAFHRAVKAASAVACDGRLVTFGMTPDAPETEYGYIEAGPSLGGGACEIARFVEKPDAATARQLLDKGNHYWNSGMFLFPVRELLEEFRIHAPRVLEAASASVPAGVNGATHLAIDEAAFAASPSISVDYAVMEHTARAAVVPCEIGWSDVGNWNALWNLNEHDADANVLLGNAISQGSTGSYLRSDGPLVVGVGLENVVVVATADAVLVGDQSRVREVNKAVDALAARDCKEAGTHNRIYCPWGFYESLNTGPRFQVKRICVNPGAKLSLQKHLHRSEHWVVVQGSAVVTRDDEQVALSENESIYLPLGCTHRLENPGDDKLTLIEVRYGSYLGEDDIVRIEDDYGRAD